MASTATDSPTSSMAPPKTPSSLSSKRVAFVRPTLIIQPSQDGSIASRATTIRPGRKASVFVFDQLHGLRDFTMHTAKTGMGVGEKSALWMYHKFGKWSRQWFTHLFLGIVIVLYTFGGAVLFQMVEGGIHEPQLIEHDLHKEKYEIISMIHDMSSASPVGVQVCRKELHDRLKDYESKVKDNIGTRKLKPFTAKTENGSKIWTLWNAMVYCGTVYTTIGYGHLSPSTHVGKIVTIFYAIVGIPLFLIALTDFGKLFTRSIKYVWSYVRRLHYTGNCRKARKTAHVHEIMKGAQMMYEIATFRRPSTFVDPENPENVPSTAGETPTTPAMSAYEINDEFNLPITLAIFILLIYLFLGALIYWKFLEDNSFFDAFYFVFISMSTIGFGDIVPSNAILVIVTLVYLVFGLALMSMCFNVVQEKLDNTVKQATARFGATIGLRVGDDGSISTMPPDGVELPAVHQKDVSSKFLQVDAMNDNEDEFPLIQEEQAREKLETSVIN